MKSNRQSLRRNLCVRRRAGWLGGGERRPAWHHRRRGGALASQRGAARISAPRNYRNIEAPQRLAA